MDPVDWQTRKTLSESTKYMLENSVNCDVNFKVGENQEIVKAHKFILTIRSAVFDRMFNGSFCESEKDPVIPDLSPAAFKTLLRYCYYDCVDIKDDVAWSILFASTKYMLPLLEEAARKKLIEILTGSNVWDVYKYAVSFGDTVLHEGCKKYFQSNVTPVREALQAEAFLNIPHNVLLDFLHINDEVDNSLLVRENQMEESNQKPGSQMEEVDYHNCIGISISEIELFKACNAWAEAECLRQEIDPTGAKKRTVLGECLFLIRFPTMLQKDLTNVVYPTGILTQDNMIKLCQYIHKEAGSDCKTDFPPTQRQFLVTTSGTKTKCTAATVSIESENRVMLSRVWVKHSGRVRITVENGRSTRSWSKQYNTQYDNHLSESTDNLSCYMYIVPQLYFIDIEPQLLEAGTRYQVTADIIRNCGAPKPNEQMMKVAIVQQASFKELKLRNVSGNDIIHALTLSLI